MKALAYGILAFIIAVVLVVIYLLFNVDRAGACHTVEAVNDEWCQEMKDRGVILNEWQQGSVYARIDEESWGKLIVLLTLMERQRVRIELAEESASPNLKMLGPIRQDDGRRLTVDQTGKIHVEDLGGPFSGDDTGVVTLAPCNTDDCGNLPQMDKEGRLLYHDGPTECEMKMEAAMRAMEPLSVVAAERGIRWHFGYGGKVDSLELLTSPFSYDEVKVLRDQWDTVKRECWRQP